MEISGKTVLITGASRGIGAASARHLVALGANVVLTSRSADVLQSLAAELGPQAKAVPCDVSNYNQVQTAVQTALVTFGSLDVLVNNAGLLGTVRRLGDLAPDEFDQVIDVNVKGVFYMMKATLPVMISQCAGKIITGRVAFII